MSKSTRYGCESRLTSSVSLNKNSDFFNFLPHCIILHAFLSSAEFFKINLFLKNYFRNTIRVSNSLDPDQARHIVGPGLGPNCLQRLSADDTRKHRAKSLATKGTP